MSRHAYLILAHGAERELLRLIGFLDDPRNDIYVHLDAAWRTVDIHALVSAARFSNVVIVDRIPVSWGGFSVIHAEMNLISAAAERGGYSFCHLMSGLDLPVKSQDYIHAFFDEREGQNFLEPVDYEGTDRFRLRFEQYHLLQDSLVGRKRNIFKYLDFASCYAQRALGVRRFHDRKVRAAWQWATLSGELVSCLASRRESILHDWRSTYCCDELFIPTEMESAGFAGTRSDLGSLRYMEWTWQGKRDLAPRALGVEDIDGLRRPEVLFARKFPSPVSDEIVAVLPLCIEDAGRMFEDM